MVRNRDGNDRDAVEIEREIEYRNGRDAPVTGKRDRERDER